MDRGVAGANARQVALAGDAAVIRAQDMLVSARVKLASLNPVHHHGVFCFRAGWLNRGGTTGNRLVPSLRDGPFLYLMSNG